MTAPAKLLDMAEGLERILGDQALYQNLLRRFHSQYRDAGASIGAFLASGTPAQAHQLVHTIKGSAGMIGAGELYAHARALELAIELDPATAGDQLARFANALTALQAHLGSLLADATPADQSAAVRPVDAAVLVRLCALLAADDGSAIDLIEMHSAPLLARLGAQAHAELLAAAEQFDFETALGILAKAGAD